MKKIVIVLGITLLGGQLFAQKAVKRTTARRATTAKTVAPAPVTSTAVAATPPTATISTAAEAKPAAVAIKPTFSKAAKPATEATVTPTATKQ